MSCVEMKNLCTCFPGGRCNEPSMDESDILHEVKTARGGEVLIGMVDSDGRGHLTVSVFTPDYRETARFVLTLEHGRPRVLNVLLDDGTRVFCDRLKPKRASMPD